MSTVTVIPTYNLVFGDEPVSQVDGLHVAQAWMIATIDELEKGGQLPRWRAMALYTQVENMPRAGLTFLVEQIGLVGIKRA